MSRFINAALPCMFVFRSFPVWTTVQTVWTENKGFWHDNEMTQKFRFSDAADNLIFIPVPQTKT